MEKIISKIAGLGIPGLVLLVAVQATGLVGAAALTTALAALGPGGMVGGIILLGVIALAADGITKYGFDAIFSGVVKELYIKGETKESIKAKITSYPVSNELKLKLNALVDSFPYTGAEK